MKQITVNLSFYNQDNVLREQVKGWTLWPEEIRKYYSFCIVDDFSKNNAKTILENINKSNIDLSIYRVKEDLYCNIAGVRNLSASQCQTEWMVILDMDTIIPERLARSLLHLCKSPNGNCFKFNSTIYFRK